MFFPPVSSSEPARVVQSRPWILGADPGKSPEAPGSHSFLA